MSTPKINDITFVSRIKAELEMRGQFSHEGISKAELLRRYRQDIKRLVNEIIRLQNGIDEMAEKLLREKLLMSEKIQVLEKSNDLLRSRLDKTSELEKIFCHKRREARITDNRHEQDKEPT